MSGFRFRSLLAFGAVLMALVLVSADADARPKSNFGSRGTRTYTAPPSTATAPNTARPIERSMTQPGAATAARPATPAAAPGGFFNRPGLLGGLAAGFLGAGLLGMLFGNGLMGGLGGIASIIGLILQVGLILIVARLIWGWWQRRQQPAMAGAPNLRDLGPDQQRPDLRTQFGGLGGPLGGLGTTQQPGPVEAGHDEVGLTAADFDVFERLLGEIQQAYGAEDLNALKSRATPEMVSYYAEELAANAGNGLINQISDVKLLKGDLAEAWREPGAEYATVAMHYALKDRLVERATGHVVEGGDDLQEATEVWTFRRAPGGQWFLSAIQQA